MKAVEMSVQEGVLFIFIYFLIVLLKKPLSLNVRGGKREMFISEESLRKL